MADYLELTEDQMVDRLAKIQRLARAMLVTARGPEGEYNKAEHSKAVKALYDDLKELAENGDVI